MFQRMLCVFAAFSFAAAIALAGDKSTNDAKDLQGTWQAVDLEANGEKSPADQVQELHVVIKANEIAIKPDGEGRKCKFTLNSSRTPKTIDLTPHDGPRQGEIVAGIYSLQNGQLRLCVNIFGKDPAQRPTKFETHSGDGVVTVTLERAKQK